VWGGEKKGKEDPFIPAAEFGGKTKGKGGKGGKREGDSTSVSPTLYKVVYNRPERKGGKKKGKEGSISFNDTLLYFKLLNRGREERGGKEKEGKEKKRNISFYHEEKKEERRKRKKETGRYNNAIA